MGDPRPFWKESVGAAQPPTERRTPQDSAPSRGTTTPSAPPISEGATATGLLPIEEALASLPIGSVVFGDQVAKKLWADPTPMDLKALATIAERRRFIPAGVQRDAVLRAVMVRQRAQRLFAPGPRPICDSRPFHLRSAEWSRLSRLTNQASEDLKEIPQGPNEPAFLAARGLLPDVLDLEAEASVSTEAALLIEAALAGKKADGAAAFRKFSEALELLGAVQTGQSAPGDELFLEILAVCAFANRVLDVPGRPDLDRLQRAIARVSARLDRAVDLVLKQHKRDPERNTKLAHWRRRLLDAQRLINETVSQATGPQHHAPARPAAARVDPAPQTRRQTEEGMIEHLRDVQRKVGAEPEPRESPEHPRRGWRRWFTR